MFKEVGVNNDVWTYNVVQTQGSPYRSTLVALACHALLEECKT